MRRFQSTNWVPGAVIIASGLLMFAFAQAASRRPMTDLDQWSAEELAVLSSLSLKRLPPAPLDPSNAVERLPAAIDLGRRLFNDPRFSANGAVSCASCHDPKRQFQDGLPVSQGLGTGSRRAMPIVGAGHSTWLFWDGRKDSLWAQALGPLEDAVEHGANRTRYAHLMQAHYRAEYETIFRHMPDLTRQPQDAGPGGTATEKAAWAAMDVDARNDVSRIFANMGKAIAAYEKTLVHGDSRFDRYVEGSIAGDAEAQRALTPTEVNGLRIFIGKAQCVSCHNGPLFTDQQFHNTGVPPRFAARPDRGRAGAIAKLQSDEFNCLGPFSDAKAEQCQELRFIVTDEAMLEGAFKTPGLRDVALRPPFMHAGQFTSLSQVIAHYIKAPAAALGHTELAHGDSGHTERKPIRLSEKEVADLVAFLGTLSGSITEDRSR